jgi:hypothetical protein
MRHEALSLSPPRQLPWERLALLLWGLVLLAISLRVLLSPRANSVYPIFAAAGQAWLNGEDLYLDEAERGGLDQYRYSPAVAAVFAPLSLLPERLAGVLWRLLNAAAYLGAFAWWCSAALPGGASLSAGRRAALWLLLLPLSVGSLNNGQSNPLVTGLMLAAAAGCVRQRWNLAAACMAAACLFKVYPIAVGLLLVVVYPRQLGVRLLVTLATGLLLPLLLQQPEYVARQYQQWLQVLSVEDRKAEPLTNCYRDLWLLLRVAGVPPGRGVYVAIQLAGAAAVAAACLLAGRAGWPRRSLLLLVLALGVCWILLLGPATESCTYILAAPVLAWAVLQAGAGTVARWPRWLTLAGFTLLVIAQASCWFAGGKQFRSLGPQPLAAVLLAAALPAAVRQTCAAQPAGGEQTHQDRTDP